jgi:hypothetical protein
VLTIAPRKSLLAFRKRAKDLLCTPNSCETPTLLALKRIHAETRSKKTSCHPREGGDPAPAIGRIEAQALASTFVTGGRWIPAFAGMTGTLL